MAIILEPENAQQVSEIVAAAPKVFVTGGGLLTRPYRLTEMADELPDDVLSLAKLNQIVEFSVADQVLVVGAGAEITSLNAELHAHGYCIPTAPPHLPWFASPFGTLGSAISLNLPHVLTSQCGSWRDWILGMTLVRPDGTLCKCGSKAVKNVAGYDVQRLMVGARGTLGVITQVVLRVTPVGSVPVPKVIFPGAANPGPSMWIQRVRATEFDRAVELAGAHIVLADPASGTLWASVSPEGTLPRYQGDWVIRSGVGPKNIELSDPTQIRLMKRTKEIFDPLGKLNPGEMGIF